MHGISNIKIEAILTCQCHVKVDVKLTFQCQVDTVCVNAKRQFGIKLRCQTQITLG
jgi:hypothetical protein